MLPVSYSSKGSNLSRDNELAISRRMKKFYKSHSLGENAKLDEDIHKIENSIISDNIDSYSKEHSFDFNEDIIDSEEYEVDKILGKQIMLHLGDFFNRSIKNKTRRVQINKKTKTRRKINVN